MIFIYYSTSVLRSTWYKVHTKILVTSNCHYSICGSSITDTKKNHALHATHQSLSQKDIVMVCVSLVPVVVRTNRKIAILFFIPSFIFKVVINSILSISKQEIQNFYFKNENFENVRSHKLNTINYSKKKKLNEYRTSSSSLICVCTFHSIFHCCHTAKYYYSVPV